MTASVYTLPGLSVQQTRFTAMNGQTDRVTRTGADGEAGKGETLAQPPPGTLTLLLLQVLASHIRHHIRLLCYVTLAPQ